MTTINYTAIIEAVICLIITVITSVLIPFIKSKLSAEQQKKIAEAIKFAVQAAEQIYKNQSGAGELKKAHVLTYLEEKGYIENALNVSTEIDNLIESAVYSLGSK